jgi:hypothetical protein
MCGRLLSCFRSATAAAIVGILLAWASLPASATSVTTVTTITTVTGSNPNGAFCRTLYPHGENTPAVAPDENFKNWRAEKSADLTGAAILIKGYQRLLRAPSVLPPLMKKDLPVALAALQKAVPPIKKSNTASQFRSASDPGAGAGFHAQLSVLEYVGQQCGSITSSATSSVGGTGPSTVQGTAHN